MAGRRFIARPAASKNRLSPTANDNVPYEPNTPFRDAGNEVLEGVTRRVVQQCARELAIPLVLDAPRLDAVAGFDEAAISSSSCGLVPVVSINRQAIAQGVPGPLVRALRAAYDDYVSRHICRAV